MLGVGVVSITTWSFFLFGLLFGVGGGMRRLYFSKAARAICVLQIARTRA